MSDPRATYREPVEEPRDVDDVVGRAHEGLADAEAARRDAADRDTLEREAAQRDAVHDDELQIAAWRPHGHISDLYVDPAYRANGFGQGLLRAMIERLQAMGAQRVRIAAFSANAAAIRLYRRLGFQPFSIALDLDLTPGAS